MSNTDHFRFTADGIHERFNGHSWEPLLHPCPHCGGKGKLESREIGFSGHVFVRCTDCQSCGSPIPWKTFIEGESKAEKKAAIEAWNRRT